MTSVTYTLPQNAKLEVQTDLMDSGKSLEILLVLTADSLDLSEFSKAIIHWGLQETKNVWTAPKPDREVR